MADCKDSGFGVVTADGKFLKFDSAGDEKAVKLLEAPTRKTTSTCRSTAR